MSLFEELIIAYGLGSMLLLLEEFVFILFPPLLWAMALFRVSVMLTQNILSVIYSKERFLWGLNLTGALMNILAISVNGFKMPVFRKERVKYIGIHTKGTSKTRLKFFCDRFDGGDGASYSIGDAVLCATGFLLLVRAIQEQFGRIVSQKREVHVL